MIPFDLSGTLGMDYPATSPNLMASFLRICENETLDTSACATSQAFYVIRGAGSTESEFGTIEWSEGDLFVMPATSEVAVHKSTADSAIYWISDEPLMKYLGVSPVTRKFEVTHFKKETMYQNIEAIKHEAGAEHKNRIGVLLGTTATKETTKTLTHTMWSLLNCIPAGDNQRPHRHNSVALDFAVSAKPGVYTLMGPELDEHGWVKNPIRCDWAPGSVFVTPPGWWHSHHNESGEEAYVLPMQDAGLLTHQRVLDIQFSEGTTPFAGSAAAQQKKAEAEKKPLDCSIM